MPSGILIKQQHLHIVFDTMDECVLLYMCILPTMSDIQALCNMMLLPPDWACDSLYHGLQLNRYKYVFPMYNVVRWKSK